MRRSRADYRRLCEARVSYTVEQFLHCDPLKLSSAVCGLSWVVHSTHLFLRVFAGVPHWCHYRYRQQDGGHYTQFMKDSGWKIEISLFYSSLAYSSTVDIDSRTVATVSTFDIDSRTVVFIHILWRILGEKLKIHFFTHPARTHFDIDSRTVVIIHSLWRILGEKLKIHFFTHLARTQLDIDSRTVVIIHVLCRILGQNKIFDFCSEFDRKKKVAGFTL